MLKPPINELLKKVDSRYTLVIVASKRAREIIDGSEKRTDIQSNKPVTIAVNELLEDKISFKRIESDN
ncbi:DNA-directed RNA polymerase subunit omega [Maledivibacter halophilus]|uniref:DNA-directed RNA polymerase subunit omega n=1 Tax=Maledivibacter halophilus TaxID=36842 RepID=A0A1T5MGQ9_9FIRM|nr:DNA-directed RNA polymerase subunit omega [Maledivibacter halophilus]SKC87253.1 DNA-directed RNA polymerase subunit omega [Maledivibacter halophilus]